jgi:hypothetical protein
MFNEMRQSLLVVVFENRAGFDGNPKFCALFRFPVFPDVVRYSIVEFADENFRIGRKNLIRFERFLRLNEGNET